MSNTHEKVHFELNHQYISTHIGVDILRASRLAGIELCSACYGHALCGACRLKIIEGQQNLSPIETEELKALMLLGYIKELQNTKHPNIRLACQAFLHGPVKAIFEG